jgi:hypothetical protein
MFQASKLTSHMRLRAPKDGDVTGLPRRRPPIPPGPTRSRTLRDGQFHGLPCYQPCLHSSSSDIMRSLRLYRTVLRPPSVIPAPRMISVLPSPVRQPTRIPRASVLSSALTIRRSFHQSHRRQDVFFLALPALKSSLLNVTRFTLLFLPFVFRYKLWKKYKKTSYLLIQIPVSPGPRL